MSQITCEHHATLISTPTSTPPNAQHHTTNTTPPHTAHVTHTTHRLHTTHTTYHKTSHTSSKFKNPQQHMEKWSVTLHRGARWMVPTYVLAFFSCFIVTKQWAHLMGTTLARALQMTLPAGSLVRNSAGSRLRDTRCSLK